MDIFKNPHFIIIKDTNSFIFYNSCQHFVCRISELDLSIFNLIYLHRNLLEITKHINSKYIDYVKSVYDTVIKYNVLSTNEEKTGTNAPISKCFYLHLTYHCNLNCIYCYNKSIRKNISEINLSKWKIIITKVLPLAKEITITGGEPFLSPILPQIIEFIKNNKPSISIGIISNCMTDFETYNFSDIVFNNIDNVIFSCDNLSGIHQPRVNFNSKLFKHNIRFLRKKYTNLDITISSVLSNKNLYEIEDIKKFSIKESVKFRSVLIVPNTKSEIRLLPSIKQYKRFLPTGQYPLNKFRIYCGAGMGVLSIDPLGNVFPCQSLHYKQFKLGNLLYNPINSILSNNILEDIKENFSVDNIPICKNCNVRYICGAGCRAATLKMEGKAMSYPKTLCKYYRMSALNRLKRIPFLSDINLYKQ